MTREEQVRELMREGMEPEVARALAITEEALREELQEPLWFRDYHGTDYSTCSFCGRPIEHPEWPEHQHRDSCGWVRLRAALSLLQTLIAPEQELREVK